MASVLPSSSPYELLHSSPAVSMSSSTAGTNTYNPTQPSVTTTWKINPNSQLQMPLLNLINQAQGFIMGGPSAHHRKIGLYKTEICRNWEEKQSCRYGVKCQFAHGPADIRNVRRHPKYKTEICRVSITSKFRFKTKLNLRNRRFG